MTDIRLVVRQGPQAGQAFELSQPVHHVGRSKENDIQLDDIKISRRHASLTHTAAGYVLQDLGSTNGTFVNDQRVTGAVVLQPGDVIRFGDNVMVDVQSVAGAGRAAVTPPVYAPPPAAYPPPPPPPVITDAGPRHTTRNLALGCGLLLMMLICIVVTGYLVYQYAPPEVATPICNVLSQWPVLEALCR